jgi:stalled ribosome rescue protein Dom34
MMSKSVSIVWIDHEQAKVFHFSDERMLRETVRTSHHDHHTRHPKNVVSDFGTLYDDAANQVLDARKILILGPGLAKTQFFHRLQEKYPTLAKKVVGCEASDHPSDHQIAAYAIQYLHRKPLA